MNKYRLPVVACFLFITGMCALIFQTVWLREMRFIFGGSTAATSAVLAVFLGGLGFGGIYWGRFVDRFNNPLKLYAFFEIGIGVSAALSLLVISVGKMLYVALGGSVSLGPIAALLVRLMITLFALGIPTFLMGGTLPAMGRSIEQDNDLGRRDLAVLYGVNTLGAVVGVIIATFYMLEHLGSFTTLILAVLLNLTVGGTAYFVSRDEAVTAPTAKESVEGIPRSEDGGRRNIFILVASGIVGFVFLLMELVWYRMLAPILGGTTFTFGLILAVALGGIGIGSFIYSVRGRSIRPTFTVFSFTCCLEGLFLVIPFALGDRLAILGAYLQPLGNLGLQGHVLGWFLITAIVVLPVSIVSGYQFPLLIGLLGQGREQVGRHVGLVYATNTIGAIIGSLAGAILLMPILTAISCWQIAMMLMLLLGVAAMLMSIRLESKKYSLVFPVALTALAILLFANTQGPTSVWRHSPIGAGRTNLVDLDINGLKAWGNDQKRGVVWESEGVESSIALMGSNSFAFFVNGKSDGNAKGDAGTQIMGPLVAAILHPGPKKALVIGLGTGSSGGWLAKVESIKKVDIVELEPSIVHVARRCAPVNHAVLDNPKVEVFIGDGREVILTTDEKYDLIFSEPSNPYRAGVASLYTKEFYQDVSERLEKGGYFSQWVQGYEIDRQTFRTIYATLASVFGSVTVWQTLQHDILFVCSKEKRSYSGSFLRKRVEREPFRSALINSWNIHGLEGFLAAFLANDSVARKILTIEKQHDRINTDDRMLVEFGFARSVGVSKDLVNDFRNGVRAKNAHLLFIGDEPIDWQEVGDNYYLLFPWGKDYPKNYSALSKGQQQQLSMLYYYQRRDYRALMGLKQLYFREPYQPLELAAFGEALAEYGDAGTLPIAEQLRAFWPSAADAILSRFYLRTDDKEQAYRSMGEAIKGFRDSPWTHNEIIRHALDLSTMIAQSDPDFAKGLVGALKKPFSVNNLNDYRILKLFEIGLMVDGKHALVGLEQMEPHVFWEEELLNFRMKAYRETRHPLFAQAERDLKVYRENMGETLTQMLAN